MRVRVRVRVIAHGTAASTGAAALSSGSAPCEGRKQPCAKKCAAICAADSRPSALSCMHIGR